MSKHNRKLYLTYAKALSHHQTSLRTLRVFTPEDADINVVHLFNQLAGA